MENKPINFIFSTLLCCFFGCAAQSKNSDYSKSEMNSSVLRSVSAEGLKQYLGKRIQIVGEPVGSKGNYGLKVKGAGILAVNKAWNSDHFDALRKTNAPILIEADVAVERAFIAKPTEAPVQSNFKTGQAVPERIALHNVRVIKILNH